MKSIWPRCPTCSASAREGSKFRIVPEPLTAIEEHEPQLGETLISLAQLDCVRCGFRFPLWTYKVGDGRSFQANATDDEGNMWDPYEGEPWWITGGIGYAKRDSEGQRALGKGGTHRV